MAYSPIEEFDFYDDVLLKKKRTRVVKKTKTEEKPPTQLSEDREKLIKEILDTMILHVETLGLSKLMLDANTVDDVYSINTMYKEITNLITKIKKSGCIKPTV